MTMRESNDDILNDALGRDEPLDAELVSLLDQLTGSERSAWTQADSARVAEATAGMIAPESPAVLGSIGTRRFGGAGWLKGLAAAAAVGVIVGVGIMLAQPSGTTSPTNGGPLAMGTPGPAALDDAALEEELSAWLASRVRLDPVALLSVESQSDSLDELETDLAAFWTMRSGLASVDDGFEVEGTL